MPNKCGKRRSAKTGRADAVSFSAARSGEGAVGTYVTIREKLIVARIRENPNGRGACVIGEVKAEPPGIVSMTTGFGGTRIVDMLAGEQLPRIC